MSKFEKAMHDPTMVYQYPMQVVEDPDFTIRQKLQILRQWQYDSRELQIAEEENMLASNDKGSMMHRVLEAIHILEEREKEEKK